MQGGDGHQGVPNQAQTHFRTFKVPVRPAAQPAGSTGLFLAFIVTKSVPKLWMSMIIFFFWKEQPKKALCVESGHDAGDGSPSALLI